MDISTNDYNLENTVIKKINEEFKDDLSKLNNCNDTKSKLEEEKQRIENLLALNSCEGPSKISTAIKHVQETFDKIKLMTQQHNDLNKSIDHYEKKVLKVKSLAEDYIEKLVTLEKAHSYLDVLREIEELSNSLEASVIEKNEKKQISNFLTLRDLHKTLIGTKCTHLLTYINETLHYWHNILKNNYTSDFDELLKILKWPFIGNAIISLQTQENLNKLQTLTENLLQIQLDKPEYISTTAPFEIQTLSLPISQLIKPLKKRFLYHFMGKKQTNRADKPEWYLTQILTWIREHQDFVEKNFQSVYDKFGIKSTPVKIEFMRGLVEIAVEKLHYELPQLHYDDSLFSHCIDEVLGFDKELKNNFGYPSTEPGVIEVLTKAQIFVKWISTEKRFALEKMDTLLTSSTAFHSLVSGDLDENKVTECGNSFLTLLSTITERYENLPQPGHKLQFLELQLGLIDDFRVRLLQKLHEENSEPLKSNFPYILNTVSYVKDVLDEWGVNTLFLHLQYYKCNIENKADSTGTVFDKYSELLGKMRDDLLTELIESVFMEVKAKSMPYRKDKWHAMESIKNVLKPTITVTACAMFQELISKLHKLQEVMAVALFKQAWKILATKIDQYLYEEIVSICIFNEGGAMQFSYDITKNLFPLFGQYSKKPEASFKLLRDSCVLLSMGPGMALSLMQAITDKSEDVYEASEILAEVGVYTLQKEEVLSLLKRRTDLDNSLFHLFK